MRVRLRQVACGAGGLALVSTLFMGAQAGAATAQPRAAAKSFASSSFKAYSSGELAHVGSLDTGSALADTELGYATSSVNSGGLTSALHGDSANGNLVVQPAQKAGVKAYGEGAGATADLNASSPAASGLPDLSNQVAPPYNGSIKFDDLAPDQADNPGAVAPTGDNASNALIGASNANFTNSCLIGKPLAYGAGSADGADLFAMNNLPSAGSLVGSLNSALTPLTSVVNSVLSTAGTGTLAASDTGNNEYLVENNGAVQTLADTYLTPEGGGKWGVASFESSEPSPLRINLLGLVQLNVSVLGQNDSAVPSPITLLATASGSSSGASVKLHNADTLDVTATVAGETVTLFDQQLNTLPDKGTTIPLNLGGATGLLEQGLAQVPGIGSVLNTVKGLLGDNSTLNSLSLGSLNVGQLHAIGNTSKAPSITGGTAASGSYDLLNLDLAPTVAGTTTTLAQIALDHLETSADLSSPISCSVPVTSASSGAGNVKVGGSTTITAKSGGSSNMASLLACRVSSATVTEKVTSSRTDFSVSGASAGGRVSRQSSRSSTITWSDKTIAGRAPLTDSAKLRVPTGSKPGSIKTTVSVSGKFAGCDNATADNAHKQIANGRVVSGTANHTLTVKS